jgi:nucleoside-diphosphate-sugar epimerase
MKYLVTGHQGFIGSYYYNRVYPDAIGCDLQSHQDLKDCNFVQTLPDVDVVVHLAATNGTKLFYEQPVEVAFNNTLPTFNLVDRYRNTNTKFVFASTCEIFNGAVDTGIYPVPTDERVPILFQDIENPRWSYSIPKALGENLVINSGMPWLVIRYFNIYGPGQKDHFVSEFVQRVKKQEYYINGNDTRSFCYIDDAIEMTHQLILNHSNRIVNVGHQDEIEISTVAKIIMEIMGVDPNLLTVHPSPKGSVTRRCPDTALVQKLTGFTKYTTLYNGLKKTIESLL